MAAIPVDNMGTIDLGLQGENLATTIEIDVSSMLNKWPAAAITLLVKRRGDTDPYFANTSVVNKILRWPITSVETAVSGEGKIEVQARQGDVIDKSFTATIKVTPSLSGAASEELPEVRPSWVDEILSLDRGGATFYVKMTPKAGVSNRYTADKTKAEIEAAYNAGCAIYAVVDEIIIPLSQMDYTDWADGNRDLTVIFTGFKSATFYSLMMMDHTNVSMEQYGLAVQLADTPIAVPPLADNKNSLFHVNENGTVSLVKLGEGLSVENGEVKAAGGGASSWNDLTDKPFEAGYDALLLDQTATLTVDESGMDGVHTECLIPKLEFIAGETYTVYVADKAYTAVAEFVPGVGVPVVGNTASLGGTMGEDLPFMIATIDATLLGGTGYLMVADFAEITTPGDYRVVIAHGDHPLGTVTRDNVDMTFTGMMQRISKEVPTAEDLVKGEFVIKCLDENGAEVEYTRDNTSISANDDGNITISIPPGADGISRDEDDLVAISPNLVGSGVSGTFIFTYSRHPVQSITVNGYYKYRKTRPVKQIDPQLIPGGVYPITLTLVSYTSPTESTWTCDRTINDIVAAAEAGKSVVANIVRVYGETAKGYSFTTNVQIVNFTIDGVTVKNASITEYTASTSGDGAYTPKVSGYWLYDESTGLFCKYFDD